MFRYVGKIGYNLGMHTIEINKFGLFCCCSLEISHIYTFICWVFILSLPFLILDFSPTKTPFPSKTPIL